MAGFVIVNVAFGMTAPDESVTVPVIVPVATCPKSVELTTRRSAPHTTKVLLNTDILLGPSDSLTSALELRNEAVVRRDPLRDYNLCARRIQQLCNQPGLGGCEPDFIAGLDVRSEPAVLEIIPEGDVG